MDRIERLKKKYHPDIFNLLKKTKAVPWPVKKEIRYEKNKRNDSK